MDSDDARDLLAEFALGELEGDAAKDMEAAVGDGPRRIVPIIAIAEIIGQEFDPPGPVVGPGQGAEIAQEAGIGGTGAFGFLDQFAQPVDQFLATVSRGRRNRFGRRGRGRRRLALPRRILRGLPKDRSWKQVQGKDEKRRGG